MILVTGAAGKTGRAIIAALVTRGASVRALVHRPEKVSLVEEWGAQEVVVGDVRDPATMTEAARDARAVYHICPNMSPDEVSIGQTAMTASRDAGVEHFVYHSVLHPQTEAMPHHWLKLRVEEKLFESGLPYTVLQPAAYMQNVLAYWTPIVEQGVYPVPYASGTRLGMVDLKDVAAVAALVLTDPGHVGATYELAGGEVLTQEEVAEILGQKLGRSVRTGSVSLGAWEQRARSTGMGDYEVDSLIRMFDYYERFGFWGNPRVLGWLLGRPPTTFADFVERTVKERSGSEKD